MRLGFALLAATLLATPALAQAVDPHAGMKAHDVAPSTASPGASEPSMMDSMKKMSQAMSDAPMTGDADHDFVVMMIPHHQGAIDMAKYELQHGKDAGLRKLARAVIAAQEKEIGEMRRWLASHPAK